jgi:hypothetical protein
MVLLTPSKDVIERVRAEFGLDEAGMKQAVQVIKDWLKMQPHLPGNCGEL